MKTKLFISFVLLFSILTTATVKAVDNWTQTSLNNQSVSRLASIGSIIFANGNLVYKTTDNGGTWTSTGTGGGIDLCTNGPNIFVVNSFLIRSTNNGVNWVQFNLSAADGLKSLAGSGNNVYAGSIHYGLRRSTDNGDTWSVIPGLNGTIDKLAANGNTVFAMAPGGLYRSTDGGVNWSPTTLPIQQINSIVFNGTTVYAASAVNGVYVSTDNGVTWNQTSLASQSIQSLAVTGSNVFAGSNTLGVYVSTNSGVSWVLRNEGMGNKKVDALLISGDYIFAGTYGYGVWKRPLSELISVQIISTEVPDKFVLYQNYPNPFNPSTNIKFSIPKASFVKLAVYDMLGREVEVLANENVTPGTYEVTWDASKVSSGIYFYRLNAENYSDIKKMSVIK